MAIRPRKLVFFIIDDTTTSLLLPDKCPIEIWQSRGVTSARLRPSVTGWLQHCRQAYIEHEIHFDALSIDVNFASDGSDPMWSLNRSPPKNIYAGLYHGLAALARRRGNDEHGNALPCAWEIRTAAPGAAFTVDQEVEVARAFGLLLALATPYSKDGGFIGLGEDNSTSPAEQVLAAFRAQPMRSGAALDSIVNLLPKWRERFVEAVAQRRVRIDFEHLKSLKEDLLRIRRSARDKNLSLFELKPAVVTLLDRDRAPCEQILLSSIFGDNEILTDDVFEEQVTPWLKELVDLAPINLSGYVDSTVDWITAAGKFLGRAHDHPEGAPQKHQNFMSLDIEHRMLILISYEVASWLDGRRFPRAKQDDLAAALGFTLETYHTFARVLSGTADLCSLRNVNQLKCDVLQHMGDRKLNLRFAPALSQTLANVLYDCDLEHQVREGFPALVPYLECAG